MKQKQSNLFRGYESPWLEVAPTNLSEVLCGSDFSGSHNESVDDTENPTPGFNFGW